MKNTCILILAFISSLFGVVVPVHAEVRGHAVRREEVRPYSVQASTRGRPSLGLMVFHGAVYPQNLQASVTAFYEPFFQELVAEFPLAVVYPTGLEGRCPWDKTLVCWPMTAPWQDTRYVVEVASRVSAEYGPTRWLALGISNGGYYLGAAIESGETLPFEGVVDCIGGRGWGRKTEPRWTPPLIILVGTKDAETLSSARELRDSLEKAGYPKKAGLRYVEFDGGHELPEALLKAELRRLLEAAARP